MPDARPPRLRTTVLEIAGMRTARCAQLVYTALAGVPTLWIQLMQRHSPLPTLSFPHLRYITNSGGVFPVDLVKRYREHLPPAPVAVAAAAPASAPATPPVQASAPAAPAEAAPAAAEATHLPEEGLDLREHMAQIELTLIREALERTQGVVAHAAQLLGLRRTTLVEKLRKYGIEREHPELAG